MNSFIARMNSQKEAVKTQLLSAIKDIHNLQSQIENTDDNTAEDISEILNDQKNEVIRLMGMLKNGEFSTADELKKLTQEVQELRKALASTVTTITETNKENQSVKSSSLSSIPFDDKTQNFSHETVKNKNGTKIHVVRLPTQPKYTSSPKKKRPASKIPKPITPRSISTPEPTE